MVKDDNFIYHNILGQEETNYTSLLHFTQCSSVPSIPEYKLMFPPSNYNIVWIKCINYTGKQRFWCLRFFNWFSIFHSVPFTFFRVSIVVYVRNISLIFLISIECFWKILTRHVTPLWLICCCCLCLFRENKGPKLVHPHLNWYYGKGAVGLFHPP